MELRSDGELAFVDVARERALSIVDVSTRLFVAQATPELDQLIGARAGLSQLEQEMLDGDQHEATVARRRRGREHVV